MSKSKVIVIALVLIVAAFTAGWFYSSTQEAAAVAQKVPLVLPDDTERITPCFPGYAAHWTAPRAISYDEGVAGGAAGPTFMVDDDTNRVIGIEYHFTLDALQDYNNDKMYALSPDGDPENPEVNSELGTKANRFGIPRNLLGANYEYFDIKWSAGHSGFEFGHIDIHLYTIPPEERLGVCGGIEGVSPQLYQLNQV